jgi:hypothetical protein
MVPGQRHPALGYITQNKNETIADMPGIRSGMPPRKRRRTTIAKETQAVATTVEGGGGGRWGLGWGDDDGGEDTRGGGGSDSKSLGAGRTGSNGDSVSSFLSAIFAAANVHSLRILFSTPAPSRGSQGRQLFGFSAFHFIIIASAAWYYPYLHRDCIFAYQNARN